MKRRLFTILSALSLLLFLTLLLLWIRSYHWWDDLFHTGRAHVYTLESVNGRLVVVVNRGETTAPRHRGWTARTTRHSLTGHRSLTNWFQVRWLSHSTTSPSGTLHAWALSFPYTYPAAATLLPPTLWLLLRIRQSRRNPAGLCPHCHYDLRATPTRCPECGATPDAGPYNGRRGHEHRRRQPSHDGTSPSP